MICFCKEPLVVMLNFSLPLEPDLLMTSYTSETLLDKSLGNASLILMIFLTLSLEALVYDLPLGLNFKSCDKFF